MIPTARRLLLILVLGVLLGSACTYSVSQVRTTTDAMRCEENGGSVELNSDGVTYSCVKEGALTRIDRLWTQLLDNLFVVLLAGGLLLAGIAAIWEKFSS